MEQFFSNFEAPFRTIAQAASDAIITIDENSTILFANSAAERIFGYSIAEMVGQSLTMLMPDYLRKVHEAGLQRYIVTGHRHINWAGTELPGLRRDGSRVNVEVSFGEFFQEGRQFFTGIIRDISQRRHDERLKSAYTAAARLLAENPPAEHLLQETLSAICKALEWNLGIVWEVDRAHDEVRYSSGWCASDDLKSFLQESKERRFERGAGIPGRVWFSKEPVWILRLDEDKNFPRVGGAVRVGLLSAVAFPVVISDEVVAVMEFFSVVLEPPDRGLLDTFRTIGHQIGQYIERRKAEQALAKSEAELRRAVQSEQKARRYAEEASRAKDEFLTTLSHELRTPMTSVFGWVQLLLQGKFTDPKTLTKILGVVDRNLRTQIRLIDDLLNISQIITGKLRIQREFMDPVRVVKEAIEIIRPSADAKQIELLLEADSPVTLISADPARVQQVVWNLLANAVKFTPKQGSVKVKVGRVGSELSIAVTDTGEGIPVEFLPHVFERFSQADSSSTRQHSGLGLGLALVRQLVELHGGKVTAESAGAGKGSTFTVTLPIPGIAASDSGVDSQTAN
jgi:PAS domain S-box-containing protein